MTAPLSSRELRTIAIDNDTTLEHSKHPSSQPRAHFSSGCRNFDLCQDQTAVVSGRAEQRQDTCKARSRGVSRSQGGGDHEPKRLSTHHNTFLMLELYNTLLYLTFFLRQLFSTKLMILPISKFPAAIQLHHDLCCLIPKP
ncbi:hypothetical protein ABW19_dt0201651 [Dactylella cylindrospora]|nr:hypothetical protein ABW19_dt0201651 [Dactylella cylindrospora]